MIDELKNKAIFEKVGGAFKVSALIQKRMVELMEGSRPLIENTEGMTMMEIVVEEIMQDKIAPDYSAPEKTEVPKI
jgi:DNA-directed RNA polymerase subunit omega